IQQSKEAKAMTEEDKKTGVRRSRRGFTRYKENPFVMVASGNTNSGTRRVTANNDKLLIINQDTGEQLAGAGFFQYEEVDKTKFLKLYVNGVKALTELTSAGTKVFEILYRTIQENINKDTVFLGFDLIDQDVVSISESTFHRGMKELIKKNFIAETTTSNLYFINPDFLFNGDRLSFVKTFIKKKTEETKKIEK
ncbi:replication/maintenance protein RepL, partial [Klebsiella pneumoniae]|uniref:replication/maintenance protein RepL n=2 Tax=Klebsiella pneumoniae TaxID=573 RepID=UPI00283A9B85